MKKISTFLAVLATIIAVGCSKNDSGGSGGGGGATQNPGTPCAPDQFGNLPAGCGTPTTTSVAFTGTLTGYNQANSNNNSIVRIINRMVTYPRSGQSFGYGYPSGGGFINVGYVIQDGTQFVPVCRTGVERCRSECKNFRSNLNFSITLNQGGGILHIEAGPYHAPSGCDSRSNGTLLAADIPVFIFKTNGNQGFTVSTVRQSQALRGNSIEIVVPVGSLDPSVLANSNSVYGGLFKFNGESMGTVLLGHR
jgi:hypothetical protein